MRRSVALLLLGFALLATLLPKAAADETSADAHFGGGPSAGRAGGDMSSAQPQLVLSFVGDIMHHDVNARMAEYDRLYDAVRERLHADDLSFANIEFPVDPERATSGYPLFNGSEAYVLAAVSAGFDVFSLANNHTFDWGADGVMATKEVFDRLSASGDLHTNGLRAFPRAPVAPTVIEYHGWKIGFVAITTFSNVPGSSPYINLVNYNDSAVRKEFLALVDRWNEEFDLLVISVHSGTEYVATPDIDKAAFFRELVSHGADIVWGHHPHVLQPWETVRAGAARKLIMHSTGNFISGQRRLQQPFLPFGRWAPTGDTALFRITVARSTSVTATDVTVIAVETPMFTVLNHPEYGLVPATFGSVLANPIPLAWRAFYTARYAATRSLLNDPMDSIVIRPPYSEPRSR